MKNAHSSKVLHAGAGILFFALFALTSLSAQNNTKSKEISDLRSYSKEISTLLPSANDIKASPAFSAAGKKKFLKMIKSLEEASLLQDNASDAQLSRLRNEIADVENVILGFNSQSAKAATSPNPSPSSPTQNCSKTCSMNFDREFSACTGTKKERVICQGEAIGRWMGCLTRCYQL